MKKICYLTGHDFLYLAPPPFEPKSLHQSNESNGVCNNRSDYTYSNEVMKYNDDALNIKRNPLRNQVRKVFYSQKRKNEVMYFFI